jgi:hypothetical protein
LLPPSSPEYIIVSPQNKNPSESQK